MGNMIINVVSEYWFVYDKEADKNDPESFNGGDYVAIILYINGKPVEQYGDAYHDSSDDKIEGFISCLEKLGYEIFHERRYEMCGKIKQFEPPKLKFSNLKDALCQ